VVRNKEECRAAPALCRRNHRILPNPSPRPDQEVFLAVKNYGERERAPQPRQASHHRRRWRQAGAHGVADQMGHNLRIGFGRESMAFLLQLIAKFPEIFDNPIVDDANICAPKFSRLWRATNMSGQ
jgi:hypothetical protein